ncbi:hypothetical protein DUNSADRAFT_4552 [Dunaliella salina]|uniref:AB hydrolase-1 domain-containing protein n=1 Tax=Dunaliella salina TaxID=3046 RepID=A0ABQ7GRT1_DUNSA|nr:hypothetical protein DUNSADRAFT_4552 [Dunaliella salina]|eukprot:KAF5837289.1 hypothetical protein DUNSADRAFT_4552 [Dunaliella salina]
MPYAVDESLDDGSWSLPPLPTPSPAAAGGSSSSSSSTTGAHGPPLDGLAAIVVKPARLGGIEAALGLAAAASRHGIRQARCVCRLCRAFPNGGSVRRCADGLLRACWQVPWLLVDPCPYGHLTEMEKLAMCQELPQGGSCEHCNEDMIERVEKKVLTQDRHMGSPSACCCRVPQAVISSCFESPSGSWFPQTKSECVTHDSLAVISSCFESPVGISTLAVVAAAADALSPASDPTDSTTPTTTSSSSTTPHSPTFHSSQPYSNTQPISGTSSGAGASSGIPALGMAKGKGASTQHGLGTLQWFQPEPLFAFLCSLGAADSSVGSGSVGRGSSSGSSSSSSILLADAVHVLQQAASASPQRTANRTRLQTPSMSAAAGGPASSAPLSPPSFEELAWEQTVHTSSCSSSSSSSSTRHNSHSHPGCVITLRGILVRPRHPLPLHQTSPSPNTVTTTTHPHTTTTATHQTASIYPHPAAATGSAAAADAAASSPHSLSPSHSTCPLPSSGLVVLLHGFLGSSQDWRAHMQGLAAHGHTCLAIDLPGHGSTTITPTTVADPSTNSTIATTNAPTATDPRTTTTTSNASTNTTSDSSTTTTTSSNDAPTTAADPSTAAANSTTIITNAPTIALDPSTTSAGRHSPAAADPSIAPAAYATSRSNTSITNPSNIPSIEDCASLVGGALRQAGVERCGLLVGYSLGARLALCLAVQQPRLVGRLALVSGTPGIKPRLVGRLALVSGTPGIKVFVSSG